MGTLTIGQKHFNWGSRTYVMGILNITPDSFSGDGLLPSADPLAQAGLDALTSAVQQAHRFISAGADILDVGGESTRPGAQPVSLDEELARVVPVVRALSLRFPSTVISIDTYKTAVAAECFKVGAQLLNDVWGLRADPAMPAFAARHNLPVVLMHNRSTPANAQIREQLGGRYVGMEYRDLVEDVKTELMESVQLARTAGIPDDYIILDPGIGFGKTVEQNLELLNRLDEIRALGFPVLLGPSRKSFIGYTLDLPPDQRLEGTAAAVSVGINHGADIIRVHDVESMARVAKMTDAIVRRKVT